MKIIASQNEVALSYYRVRGLFTLAVIFATINVFHVGVADTYSVVMYPDISQNTCLRI